MTETNSVIRAPNEAPCAKTPEGGASNPQAKKGTRPTKSKSKPIPVPVGPFEQPAEDEERTVHAVYEAIAPHFSQTRHKPWPLISSFLRSLPPNAIGIDSGAGNGKYLPVSREAGAQMIALDRSSGLLSIARDENGGECVRGDLGFSGWRRGVFDFAISVAAIHHLSTPQRRSHSVQTLIRPLALHRIPPYSRFMIYVWAYEQGEMSKRRMGVLASANGDTNARTADKEGNATDEVAAESRLGDVSAMKDGQVVSGVLDEKMSTLSLGGDAETPSQEGRIGGEKVQDVLVPWVYSKPGESSKRKPNTAAPTKTKTKKDPRMQGRGGARHSTENRDSATSGSQKQEPELELEPEPEPILGFGAGIVASEAEPAPTEPKVYHRYYHLFVEGELRSMVIEAGEKEGFVIVPDGRTDASDLSIPSIGMGSSGDTGRGIGGEQRMKWMRIRDVGWEADNWWLEGEVGLFPS
ncbi:hypothetical protein I317_05101 [Kwoniella heveanensis CBS 569]|nr:hypothetical protein I317_05101 [Kwoniella heveanensis CBS 569]